MERPKIKKAQVREHCTFTRLEDGGWRVEFPVLELTATGATEDEAWQALRQGVMDYARRDEEHMARWQAWAEEHNTVEDMPDEDWEPIRRQIEAGKAASAGFPALTADTFDEFIASPTPTLVDFWAEWCMPCHALAPVLQKLAERLDGRLRVGKLNIEKHHGVFERVDSKSIPTMVLYVGGEPRHMIVGAGRSLEQLLAEIEPHLT
jgi:Thioredoxin domain-containing protein